MKIGFVSGSYPPVRCGIGDYTQRLARALAEQGASVDVITSAGCGITPLDDAVRVRPVISQWGMSCLTAVERQLRQLQPDIVNIQYPTQIYGRRTAINLLPAYLRSALRVPVVTTVHEYSTFRLLGRTRVALSSLTSSALVFPDPDNLDLFASGALCRSRCHYIPLGPNIIPDGTVEPDRNATRASYGAGPDDVVAAYFGFVSPSKGLETLIDALAMAVSRDPSLPLHLLLIADAQAADQAYAAYHQRVRQAAETLIPPARMHWTGYADPAQVSAYLRSADMAVFPFVDGASLRRTTLLAALSHGVPVISTTGVHPTDRLSPRQGVMLVPPADPARLSQAITALARDPAERQELSRSASEFAKSLEWSSIAQRTLDLYRELVENAHADRH